MSGNERCSRSHGTHAEGGREEERFESCVEFQVNVAIIKTKRKIRSEF